MKRTPLMSPGRAATVVAPAPAVPALLATLLLAACAAPAYDTILQGGRVVDGTGAPARQADVAILDGRIAAIGDLTGTAAATTLDVSGLYVAPGFIDTHSHAGSGLAAAELSHGEPLLAMGLTTVVINPDGGGPVDLVEQRGELEADGLGVNAVQLIGHGSVRRRVMSSDDRAPTDAELDEMRAIVRSGMEAGAWGLSSGTFYAPGSYSENSELIELARVAAEFGGMYTSHIRDESNYTIGVLAAVEEVIDVGRQAGLTAVVTHIKALGPPVWGSSEAIVERIEAARAEGLSVYADQYPYLASATGLSAALLPRWSQAGEARRSRNGSRIRTRAPASGKPWSRIWPAGAARTGSSSAASPRIRPSRDGCSPIWRPSATRTPSTSRWS